MNIKEYISSGILELYAADALSEKEALDVESLASKYPEVQAEINAIMDACTNYASAFSKNPRPELRSTVLEKIDEAEGKTERVKHQTKKVINIPGTGLSKGSYEYKYSRLKYMMAAILVFLIFNIVFNFFIMYKWKNTEAQMTSLVDENSLMKKDYELIKSNMDKKTGEMKMLMDRSNKVVDLKGMKMSPSSSATVYWNPKTQHVMLNVDSLPMPPSGMQYQLWALKGGKPIDAGIFDMGKDPMHSMTTQIADADSFAITLENKGGSHAPNFNLLYVMGKI